MTKKVLAGSPSLHQVLAVLEDLVLRAAGDQRQVLLRHPVEGLGLGEQLLNGLH